MEKLSSPAGSGTKRLTAIVFTDAAGSTRRMDLSEEVHVESMRQHLAELRTLAEKHQGRVVKSTGDGLLVVFESVTSALTFGLASLKSGSDARGQFGKGYGHRVGVHFGEATFADDDVYGSVVNATARIMGEAPEGSLCFSQAVFDQVRGSMELNAIPLGPRSLKGITGEIVLFMIGPKSAVKKAVVAPPKNHVQRMRMERSVRKWLVRAIVALGLMTVALIGYNRGWVQSGIEQARALLMPPTNEKSGPRAGGPVAKGGTVAPSAGGEPKGATGSRPAARPSESRGGTSARPAPEVDAVVRELRALRADYYPNLDFVTFSQVVKERDPNLQIRGVRDLYQDALVLDQLVSWAEDRLLQVGKDEAIVVDVNSDAGPMQVKYYGEDGGLKSEMDGVAEDTTFAAIPRESLPAIFRELRRRTGDRNAARWISTWERAYRDF